MRRFAGIDLGREAVPDETTICKFRHLLASRSRQPAVRGGASASRGRWRAGCDRHHRRCQHHQRTEFNQKQRRTRDPEMHQTLKGQQWYFGMKAHIGVDSRSKVIHSVVAPAANVADATVLPDLLHGSETRVWGDQAYRGQRAVIRAHAPGAQDFTNRRYRHRGVFDHAERARNRTKSGVRAKVEHCFGVIKRVFGFVKFGTAGWTRTRTGCS